MPHPTMKLAKTVAGLQETFLFNMAAQDTNAFSGNKKRTDKTSSPGFPCFRPKTESNDCLGDASKECFNGKPQKITHSVFGGALGIRGLMCSLFNKLEVVQKNIPETSTGHEQIQKSGKKKKMY